MILTCIDSSIFIRKEGKKDLGVTLSPRVKRNCLTLKEKMNSGGTLNITINSLRVDSYGQEAKTEVVYAGTCYSPAESRFTVHWALFQIGNLVFLDPSTM